MDFNTTAILAAVLAFVMVGGLGLVFAGGGNSGTRAIKRAQNLSGSGATRSERADRAKAAANDPNARRKQIVKSLKEQDKQARKATVTMSARLRQAGLAMTVRTFYIGSAVIAVAVFAAVAFLKLNLLVPIGASFAAGVGLPRWIVGFLAKRRTKKFTMAFADAIDIIVRGIRSGLPLNECLKMISRECPEPLASEFKRLVENIGMGLTMEQALEKMFERMPTPELRFFAIVLAIQQKTGGNLAEALSNLSQVLRSRRMMREKIKAMSSEAIASSFIIGSLPPGVVTVLSLFKPQYMGIMYTDPRGHMMLGFGVFWMLSGIGVMKKMINFKF